LKKPEHKHRLALTILFTGVMLCLLFITHLIVGTLILLLVRFGILTGPDHSIPTPARIIAFSTLLGIIGGGIISFYLSKIPLKPVNLLINRMNRLSDGDFETRIDFGKFWSRHPSITELSESFNRLAHELQGTEMLRSDFINNFSHEFKTPIVSIAGFAKLLKQEPLTAEQRAEYIDIIEEESLRLSQMATNVLNLSKIENQTILTDVTTYNLSEQLRSCILLLGGKWERKEIDFILEFDEYQITGSEELLKQVWINLIDNAIKFSPENGTIEIRIHETDYTLAVSILNSGNEITPEQQKKIFDKFYQADESHSTEGNGIGLAIVKFVSELHRGSVSVKSERDVTMFTVTLPKTQVN